MKLSSSINKLCINLCKYLIHPRNLLLLLLQSNYSFIRSNRFDSIKIKEKLKEKFKNLKKN